MSYGVGQSTGYPYNLSVGDPQQMASMRGGNYGCQAPTWNPLFSSDEMKEDFCPDNIYAYKDLMARYGQLPTMTIQMPTQSEHHGMMHTHGLIAILILVLVILALYYVTRQ
jgi:hypothetical protein